MIAQPSRLNLTGLTALPPLPADPDGLHMATLHPADGRALRYHFDEFMVEWIAKLVEELSRHRLTRVMEQHLNADLLRMYLEQSLYIDLLQVARGLFRRSFVRDYGGVWQKPLLCHPDLIDLTRRHWPDECAQMLKADRLRDFVRRLVRSRHPIRAWLWRVLYARPAQRSNNVSIGVELAEGADPGQKSDAFWLAHGAVPGERVVFLLEAHNRFLIDLGVQLQHITRLGARAVALHPSLRLGERIPYWAPAKVGNWVATCLRELGRVRTPGERWLTNVLARCAKRVGYWECFFREHDIVVYQHFNELTTETAARRLALERIGGVEVGKMRSQFFERASAAFFFQHELAFVWNRNVDPILCSGRTRTRALVETGYVYDHLLSVCQNEGQDLRAQLEQVGVNIIVAVYDNHSHHNNHFTEEHLLQFYQCLMKLIPRYPQLGLIVKPKKPEIFGWNATLHAAVAPLRDSDRCIILGGRMSAIAPSALACDIAVGIPASTAVCEAALAGRRVLMFDPGRCAGHAFAGHKKGIMLHDIDTFEAVLEGLITNSTSLRQGHSPVLLDELDRLRDGKSYMRAAAALNTLLQCLGAGMPKHEALEQALGATGQAPL